MGVQNEAISKREQALLEVIAAVDALASASATYYSATKEEPEDDGMCNTVLDVSVAEEWGDLNQYEGGPVRAKFVAFRETLVDIQAHGRASEAACEKAPRGRQGCRGQAQGRRFPPAPTGGGPPDGPPRRIGGEQEYGPAAVPEEKAQGSQRGGATRGSGRGRAGTAGCRRPLPPPLPPGAAAVAPAALQPQPGVADTEAYQQKLATARAAAEAAAAAKAKGKGSVAAGAAAAAVGAGAPLSRG